MLKLEIPDNLENYKLRIANELGRAGYRDVEIEWGYPYIVVNNEDSKTEETFNEIIMYIKEKKAKNENKKKKKEKKVRK